MSTNYSSTFILIAEDCPVDTPVAPPIQMENPSIAARQFAKLHEHPYEMTSDDLLFGVHADRAGIEPGEQFDARREWEAKSQACLRASPLPKRYGWGIHHDAKSRIALVGANTEEYRRLADDPSVRKVRAMRSSRARN